MEVLRDETVAIQTAEDVVRVRRMVREWALSLGFSLVDQTKIVTAASELARNTVVHGGGGALAMAKLRTANCRGLRLTFEDHGPGIDNVERAMRDGFSSKGGLGLGLGGAKRLSSEFEIFSRPGNGTRVSITRWR
ncbi:MAG: ATP-binding protein [Candidatus Binataceae bacterium]